MPKGVPVFEAALGGENQLAARWVRWLPALVIIVAVGAAYANSLSGRFVYDDLKSITQNPTIRHLWPPGSAWSPPAGGGLSGRPLVNFSFALNYAVGGESVFGYHLLNLLIHGLAALTLFGVVRRTLLQPVLRERFGFEARPLAAAVALVWAVHPLQTEAVTYLSQRTESLMGLFYLVTLYAFIRGVDSAVPRRWLMLSVGACLLGAMSKEVIVTAPLIVLLYDRTFIAGSFQTAWRRRWGFYLGLGGSWLLLAGLMRGLAARQVGYGLGVTGWDYALTECWAVMHYLRLSVWPDPLVFDYGAGMVRSPMATVVCTLLLAGTVLALWRRPVVGFVGAWFFVILAPSSSVVPVALQPVAEHRMYLPLASVVSLLVFGLYMLTGRRSFVVMLVLAVVLGVRTPRRNAVYGNEVALWEATVAQRPGNDRAQTNFGTALARSGQLAEAHRHFAEAVRLKPDDAVARYNFGNVLLQLERPVEALAECEQAVRLQPASAVFHCALGTALAQLDRWEEAEKEYVTALRLQPNYPTAQANLTQVRAQRAGAQGR